MDDYSTEPRLTFALLSHEDYCTFYHLEMSQFKEDVPFYQKHLTKQETILELACGTGRLAHRFCNLGHHVTGLDFSKTMLQIASVKTKNTPHYIQGDMRSFSLDTTFDTIIIPYNSLNLLRSPAEVIDCLKCVKKHLHTGGKLLLQLSVPNKKIIQEEGTKTFQFQMIELEDGGKLIKETIKSFSSQAETLSLEERYRLRPANKPQENQDLKHTLSLLAFAADKWYSILSEAGFSIINSYGNYDLSPPLQAQSSMLLLAAEKK